MIGGKLTPSFCVARVKNDPRHSSTLPRQVLRPKFVLSQPGATSAQLPMQSLIPSSFQGSRAPGAGQMVSCKRLTPHLVWYTNGLIACQGQSSSHACFVTRFLNLYTDILPHIMLCYRNLSCVFAASGPPLTRCW